MSSMWVIAKNRHSFMIREKRHVDIFLKPQQRKQSIRTRLNSIYTCTIKTTQKELLTHFLHTYTKYWPKFKSTKTRLEHLEPLNIITLLINLTFLGGSMLGNTFIYIHLYILYRNIKIEFQYISSCDRKHSQIVKIFRRASDEN